MPPKKPAAGPGTETTWLVVILGLILYAFFRKVVSSNTAATISSTPPVGPAPATVVPDILVPPSGPTVLYETLSHIWLALIPVSVFLSLMFIAGIVYSLIRLYQVRQAEYAALEAAAHPVVSRDISRTQLRWNRIMDRAHSESEQDWRLAIIDADIMLDELLTVLGYHGETMAEKMKRVERGDFNTIDLAWEAHKVRNRLAHEGSDYHLNGREVRRVIDLYAQVFREFKYIQ